MSFLAGSSATWEYKPDTNEEHVTAVTKMITQALTQTQRERIRCKACCRSRGLEVSACVRV